MVGNFGNEIIPDKMVEYKQYDGHEELTFTRSDIPGTGAAHPGLPVAGYKPTQPANAIEAVNVFKELEERVLRHIESLSIAGQAVDIDPRLMAVGRTQLQGAFMFLARAVFQPGRVALPGDSKPWADGDKRRNGG